LSVSVEQIHGKGMSKNYERSIEKLQKHHVEDQHGVVGVSLPIGIEVFAVLPGKAKIYHLH
jgi:hypothetical protein